MKTLDISILSWFAGTDVGNIDPGVDSPSQKVTAGEFRSVITANHLRFAVFRDGAVQHTGDAPAGKAGERRRL